MSLAAQAVSLFRRTFHAEPAVITLAPGRIEFIGNHTDYNGGSVLGASIDRSICVAARRRDEGENVLRLISDQAPVAVTVSEHPPVRREGSEAWANYVLGVLVALEARGLPRLHGLELAVVSDLPSGAGLSSSAALELASGLALCALQGHTLERAELVLACREAENRFVGVPCGVLDQGVSGFGARDHLVHIDCRAPAFSTVPLPAGVRSWIFNTHTKHALVDSLYATRHRECMDAAEILKVAWLADVTAEQVRAARSHLPDVTWRRARHVVDEIARVETTRTALARGDLAAVGQLLFDSHESSRTLFENSTRELDFLVDALRGRPGVYGARLTGGGFGGAVMAMTSDSFTADEAKAVAADYAKTFGSQPDVLTCATADGARVVSSGERKA